MQKRIQVLFAETRSGRSKKSGNDYSMTVCQCVLLGEKPQVGELVLPKDHAVPAAGQYDATFELAVDFDKRIGARVVSLVPVAAASEKSPVRAAS